MIDTGYIQMHIAQIHTVISEAKSKEYDTPRINEHVKTLDSIVSILMSFDLSTKTEGQLNEIIDILEYVTRCMSYIVHSTADDVPLEIYMALRSVMSEWIPDHDNYVFVAHDDAYCITFYYCDNLIYSTIQNVTGIDVKHKLVFFSVPTHLKNDYLCNTALYHELGHFVDVYHNITGTIKYNIFLRNITAPKAKYLNGETNLDTIGVYICEYFADVFSAQYLGPYAYSYLKYINEKGGFGETHPSTAKRIEVVNDFTSGRTNEIIDLFSLATGALSLPFGLRHKVIDLSCFFADQPYQMSDKSDFHAILSNSINLWVNDRHRFTNADGSQMHYLDAYNNLNRLIQQSAENYRNIKHP